MRAKVTYLRWGANSDVDEVVSEVCCAFCEVCANISRLSLGKSRAWCSLEVELDWVRHDKGCQGGQRHQQGGSTIAYHVEAKSRE